MFEPDHETLVIDAADRATTSSVVRTLADGIRCSWIGRALYGLFRANGLQDVKVIPTPIVSHSLADANAMLRLDAAANAAVQRGLISEKAASQRLDDLKDRHEIGTFFRGDAVLYGERTQTMSAAGLRAFPRTWATLARSSEIFPSSPNGEGRSRMWRTLPRRLIAGFASEVPAVFNTPVNSGCAWFGSAYSFTA